MAWRTAGPHSPGSLPPRSRVTVTSGRAAQTQRPDVTSQALAPTSRQASGAAPGRENQGTKTHGTG